MNKRKLGVIVIIVFVLVRAKNQMLAVLGEQTDFDVDDEDDAKKMKKKKEETPLYN